MAHMGQKVSLIAFRQILLKMLPVVELNPLIQISVQQDYLPELYPYVFSLLPKNVPSFNLTLLLLPGVDCPTPSPKPLWETLGMVEESCPAVNHFTHHKTPLTK